MWDELDRKTQEVVIPTKPKVNLSAKYHKADETQEIVVDEQGGKFIFTDQFIYLGFMLTFLLDNTIDVKHRITKASKAMGTLRHVWMAKEIPLYSKVKLYEAILINLLL